MNEWELCKENIQPLTKGRSISLLNDALAPKSGDDTLRQQQQDFETKLRLCSGDDKLDVWHKYICWAEQNFPRGGKNGNLDKLIISCIQFFQSDSEFHNNEKYIDIWLKYINNNPDASAYFNKMHSLGIGLKSSHFYKAWANYLNQLGDSKKAHGVIQEGLRQLAEPRRILLTLQKDFEEQVGRSLTREQDVRPLSTKFGEGFQILPESVNQENHRSVLVALSPLGKKLNRAPIDRVSNKKGPTVMGLPIQPRAGLKPKGKLEIWTDDLSSREENLAKVVPNTALFKHPDDDFKENKMKAGKWTKAKISSSKGEKAVSVGGILTQRADFAVHTDVEEKCLAYNQSPKRLPASFGILGSRSCASPVMAIFEPPDPKRVYTFNHALIYGGAKEMSMEEVRAAKWSAQQEKKREIAERENLKMELLKLKEENDQLKKYLRTGSDESCSLLSSAQTSPNPVVKNSSSLSKSITGSPTRAVFDLWNGTLSRTEVHKLPEDEPSNEEDRVSYAASFKPSFEIFKDIEETPSSKPSFQIFQDPTGDIKNALHLPKKEHETRFKIVPEIGINELGKPSFQIFQDPTLNVRSEKEPALQIYRDPTAEVKVFEPNKPSKPSFQIFQDPTLNIQCEKEPAFEVYLDPTAEIRKQVFELLQDPIEINVRREFGDEIVRPGLQCNEELNDSLKENRCVTEADVKPKVRRRSLGILQPSTSIPFIPLEEQNSEYSDEEEEIGSATLDGMLNLATKKGDEPNKFSSTPFSWIKPSPNPFIVEVDGQTIAQEIKDHHIFQQPPTKPRRNTETNTQLSMGKFLSPITEVNSEASKSSSSSSLSQQTGLMSGVTQTMRALMTKNRASNQNNGTRMVSMEKEPVKLANEIKMDEDFNVFATKAFQECLQQVEYQPKGQSKHVTMALPRLKIKSSLNLKTNSGKVLSYKIVTLVAKGGYGKIYEVKDDSGKALALKVSQKELNWEAYVADILQTRLKNLNLHFDAERHYLTINQSFIFNNGSILIMDYLPFGNLVDMVNRFKARGKGVPQALVLYFMWEMIQIVLNLHKCNIIHADVKPDNFMLMSKPSDEPILLEQLEPRYLKLIDFGQSIDMELYGKGATFNNKVKTDGFQCPEMLEGRPWSFQTDLFGFLGVVHILLFSEYMKIEKSPRTGQWKLTKNFRQHWPTSFYTRLFSSLLNIPNCNEIPNLDDFVPELISVINQRELNTAVKILYSLYN